MASGTGLEFAWDENKASSNVQKHGVRFEDAATIFDDAQMLSIYDRAHSLDEDRWLSIGYATSGALLVVAHTFKESAEDTSIRIISARQATTSERRYYENEPR